MNVRYCIRVIISFLLLCLVCSLIVSVWANPDSDTFTPPTKDSYVDQGSPTANYGSGAYMYVRSYYAKPTFRNARSLVEFDISDIPSDATIDVATLRLYARYSSASGRTYVVSRITGSWIEMGVTWNNKPTVTTDNEIEVTMVSADNWLEVNVKNMLQDALSDGFVGWRLKDKFENSATSKQGTFCTKEHATSYWRPQLYVEWTPVTKSWNDVSTWTFNLTSRQWLNIVSWTLNLTTRIWSNIQTWTFNLLTRKWQNIINWNFQLISLGWRTMTHWIFKFSTITIPILFMAILFVGVLIFLVFILSNKKD